MEEKPQPISPFVGSEVAVTVVGYLVSGIVVFGGGGWIVDKVFDQSFFALVGVLVGFVAGTLLVKAHFRVKAKFRARTQIDESSDETTT